MVFYLNSKTNNNNIMMKLERIKTLEDMVDYAENLASDIRLGIESVDGKCNAELIADLVVHCMDLADIKTKKELKTPWNLLSEKEPKLYPFRGYRKSKVILVKTKNGTIYEVRAYSYDEDTIDFIELTGIQYLNVVEWMEKPNN